MGFICQTEIEKLLVLSKMVFLPKKGLRFRFVCLVAPAEGGTGAAMRPAAVTDDDSRVIKSFFFPETLIPRSFNICRN